MPEDLEKQSMSEFLQEQRVERIKDKLVRPGCRLYKGWIYTAITPQKDTDARVAEGPRLVFDPRIGVYVVDKKAKAHPEAWVLGIIECFSLEALWAWKEMKAKIKT